MYKFTNFITIKGSVCPSVICMCGCHITFLAPLGAQVVTLSVVHLSVRQFIVCTKHWIFIFLS